MQKHFTFVCLFRLEMISGAVQKYKNIIRQKNLSQYDEVYPIMLDYLEKAFIYYK